MLQNISEILSLVANALLVAANALLVIVVWISNKPRKDKPEQ